VNKHELPSLQRVSYFCIGSGAQKLRLQKNDAYVFMRADQKRWLSVFCLLYMARMSCFPGAYCRDTDTFITRKKRKEEDLWVVGLFSLLCPQMGIPV